jgi:hypothetical protein
MIRITTPSDFRRIEALKVRLAELGRGFDTPRGLSAIGRMEEQLRKSNQDALSRGLDKSGVPMKPVKNPNDPRRGGTGKPLNPKGPGSRSVTKFYVGHFMRSGDFTLKAAWAGEIGQILKWHAEGKVRGAPVRDILGIRPGTRLAIKDIADNYMRSVFRGTPG